MNATRLVSILSFALTFPLLAAGESSTSGLSPDDATAFKQLAGVRDEPLPPEQAFSVSVIARNARTLVVTFTPEPGYYLYRDKFAFSVRQPPDIAVAKVALPRGTLKDDPFFGRTEIFEHPVSATVELGRRRNPSARTLTLDVKHQGCNIPLGVCYLPIEKTLDVPLPKE